MNLAEKWKLDLAHRKVAEQAERDDNRAIEGRVWVARMIVKLIPAIEAAATRGESQIEIGNFQPEEVLTAGQKGEFYPTSEELVGGALLLYDYCQREGLHLFVGGDLSLGGSYRPPFEVIIRLKR